MCARRERERLLTRPSGWRTIAAAYRRLRIYAPQLYTVPVSAYRLSGSVVVGKKCNNVGVARGWTGIARDLLWCTTHRARSHYISLLFPRFFLSVSLSLSLSFYLPHGIATRGWLQVLPEPRYTAHPLIDAWTCARPHRIRKPSDFRDNADAMLSIRTNTFRFLFFHETKI